MSNKKNEKSQWFIVSPNGSIQKAEDFGFAGEEDLKHFYHHESSGSRIASEAPAHVKLMQGLGLVNYEPAADSGNFRWLPKGHTMKRLMEQHVSAIVRKYGGMQVETPIMYDLEHPALSRYLARFPARQYQLLSGDKKFFLRFAACFGQYLIMHDMQISHAHLPVRIYELTHYSFRREQSGELAGLRRLRGFTMPDMHTLCADFEQAKAEFFAQYILSKQWMESLGIGYVMAVRVVKDFFESNRNFILGIAKDLGRPILFEMWNERSFYFILKFEFNVVDGQKKAAALSTVQIDVENPERFDITYVDSDGKAKHPLMLHASISGSIDRNLYALLESEATRAELGQVPKLPYWLAPTQVMLLPVSDKHVSHCVNFASQLANSTRIEVDDSPDRLNKKIREAEMKWIPFIVVVGDKEVESDNLSVRKRGITGQTVMSRGNFLKEVVSAQGDKPFETICWPMLVSKQARFR